MPDFYEKFKLDIHSCVRPKPLFRCYLNFIRCLPLSLKRIANCRLFLIRVAFATAHRCCTCRVVACHKLIQALNTAISCQVCLSNCFISYFVAAAAAMQSPRILPFLVLASLWYRKAL